MIFVTILMIWVLAILSVCAFMMAHDERIDRYDEGENEECKIKE